MIEGFRLGVFSRGTILWDGLDFAFGNAALARAWRASCGHVPEQTVADARLTVGDLFCRSALTGGGVRESEGKDRTDRLLEMVGPFRVYRLPVPGDGVKGGPG